MYLSVFLRLFVCVLALCMSVWFEFLCLRVVSILVMISSIVIVFPMLRVCLELLFTRLYVEAYAIGKRMTVTFSTLMGGLEENILYN